MARPWRWIGRGWAVSRSGKGQRRRLEESNNHLVRPNGRHLARLGATVGTAGGGQVAQIQRSGTADCVSGGFSFAGYGPPPL
jgi:hypothetical protein